MTTPIHLLRPILTLKQHPSTPNSGGSYSPSPNLYLRGSDYLHELQRFALSPEMVNLFEELSDRTETYTWIGNCIDTVNTHLMTYLDACHACFRDQERRSVQILAAPLTQAFGIDALCNILTNPITILIDVGRIAPQDWLSVVAHEYAHAHLGHPGHNQDFVTVLSHLCLGLGLVPPTWKTEMETDLRHWPHHTSHPNPLTFWTGQV